MRPSTDPTQRTLSPSTASNPMKTLIKNETFIAGFSLGVVLTCLLFLLLAHLTPHNHEPQKHEKPPTQILTSPTFNPAWSHSDAPGAYRSPGHSQIGKPESLNRGGLFSISRFFEHNASIPKMRQAGTNSQNETGAPVWVGRWENRIKHKRGDIAVGLFNIMDIIIFHGAEYSLAALAHTEEAGARPGWLSRSWNLSHFGNFQGSFPCWDTVCNGVAFDNMAWACDVMTSTGCLLE